MPFRLRSQGVSLSSPSLFHDLVARRSLALSSSPLPCTLPSSLRLRFPLFCTPLSGLEPQFAVSRHAHRQARRRGLCCRPHLTPLTARITRSRIAGCARVIASLPLPLSHTHTLSSILFLLAPTLSPLSPSPRSLRTSHPRSFFLHAHSAIASNRWNTDHTRKTKKIQFPPTQFAGARACRPPLAQSSRKSKSTEAHWFQIKV